MAKLRWILLLMFVVMTRCGDIHKATRFYWSQKCRNGIFQDILQTRVVSHEAKGDLRYMLVSQNFEEENNVFISRKNVESELGVRVWWNPYFSNIYFNMTGSIKKLKERRGDD